MTKLYTSFKALRLISAVLASLLLLSCGCSPEARYKINAVHIRAQEKTGKLTERQQRDIALVVTSMFGTPDDPHLPQLEDVDISEVLDIEKIRLAAGPVKSDEVGRQFGLYREHCVHCHGISGDGAGPTAAFLNPYPRDYRRGTYKFKSTPSELPPTHDDLVRILYNGIPGTAMPSFKVLDEGQLDALVHYVKYLTIRGTVERALIEESANELTAEDRLIDPDLKQKEPDTFQSQASLIKEIATGLIQSWIDTEAVPVPAPPEDWESSESVAEGKRLFFTTLTNCSKCHGETALGDGQITDYDEWTKDWTVKLGLNLKTDQEDIDQFLELGALEPRNIRPRNLRQGVFRGGRRPIDLYWRVKNGIAGSPMPNAAAGLSDEQIWNVIAYVRSLQYDELSRPDFLPEYQRDIP